MGIFVTKGRDYSLIWFVVTTGQDARVHGQGGRSGAGLHLPRPLLQPHGARPHTRLQDTLGQRQAVQGVLPEVGNISPIL